MFVNRLRTSDFECPLKISLHLKINFSRFLRGKYLAKCEIRSQLTLKRRARKFELVIS